MAGAIEVRVTGLNEALARMRLRSSAVRDLTPALKVMAAQIEKTTDDAFMSGRSPAGEKWPPLAPSTLAARARALAGARRRTKSGKLTGGAQKLRAKIIGNSKPLINTGRLRNSQHARVTNGTTIEWSEVWYGGPHVTGGRGDRPPKRNMSVFELSPGKAFALVPAIEALYREAIRAHVAGGK